MVQFTPAIVPTSDTLWQMLTNGYSLSGLHKMSDRDFRILTQRAQQKWEKICAEVGNTAPNAVEPLAHADVLNALHQVDDFIARCNGDDRGSCESVNILRRALKVGKYDAPPAWADQAVIEYQYTGGTQWCPLGPAERMKADFDGVYRLRPGEFPTPTPAAAEPVAKLSDQEMTLLEQAASMLEGLANDERNRGNCSTAEGAGCIADAVRRLASALTPAAPADAPIAASNSLPSIVREALEFYAGGTQRWVTFNRAMRDATLKEYRDSPFWQEAGKDDRGHEHFIVNERKADDALSALDHWIDDLSEATPADALDADMFWNDDDSERQHGSIEEFLNDEICNGSLEVGEIRTLQQGYRLPNITIRVTAIDEESCDAEFEIIDPAIAAQAAQAAQKGGAV